MSSYQQMSESACGCSGRLGWPWSPHPHPPSLVWGSESVGALGSFSRGLAPLGSPRYKWLSRPVERT